MRLHRAHRDLYKFGAKLKCLLVGRKTIPWLLDTPENLKLHGYPKIADILLEEISKDNIEG